MLASNASTPRPLLAPLLPLVDCCAIQECDPCNDWPIDLWELDSNSVGILVSAYRQLLLIDAPDPVMAQVHQEAELLGLNLEIIFLDEERLETASRESRIDFQKKVRADLTELAAAASLISSEAVRLDDVVMPNIPKRKRTTSEHGLDFIAISPDAFRMAPGNDNARPHIAPDDRLHVGSVKHTIGVSGNMCQTAIDSVSDTELSVSYLQSELRVFLQRLDGRCPRVLLVLSAEYRARHLSIFAIGAFPTASKSKVEAELLNRLPQRDAPVPRFRQLSIIGLETLHDQVTSPIAVTAAVAVIDDVPLFDDEADAPQGDENG